MLLFYYDYEVFIIFFDSSIVEIRDNVVFYFEISKVWKFLRFYLFGGLGLYRWFCYFLFIVGCKVIFFDFIIYNGSMLV